MGSHGTVGEKLWDVPSKPYESGLLVLPDDRVFS